MIIISNKNVTAFVFNIINIYNKSLYNASIWRIIRRAVHD